MRSLIAVLLFLSLSALGDEQRFASIGDLKLGSGDVIRDCRIGYRTAGTLNETRSNALVVLTWFGGRTADLQSAIGPGKLYDTDRWFVVAIDALGNSVSCSPSNSVLQKGAAFPRFTIADMVRSQYELLTRELRLDRVHAIAGASMGGMQAWQWAVSYPKFARKIIPIVGTPKQTAYDLVLWRTELEAIESADDDEERREALEVIAGIGMLVLWTPEWTNRTAEDLTKRFEARRKSIARHDPYDYMSQLRAMIAHDIGAVEKFESEILTIVALEDLTVNPQPSRDLARKTGAHIVTLSGDCGHLASACESEIVRREVWKFLGEP
ncbi:MAG TPA: alpha/beta fold hydrolase [Thermoanaerobaculia bacterium]